MTRFLCVILMIFTFYWYSADCIKHGNYNDEEFKNLVSNIMKTIAHITTEKLNEIKPGEKYSLKERIERKLMKAAKSLGKNQKKEVDVVMQGIITIAFLNSLKNKGFPSHEMPAMKDKISNSHKTPKDPVKEQAIQKLLEKIQKISSDVNTILNKISDDNKFNEHDYEKGIKKLKENLDYLGKERNISNTHTDLILDGIKLMMYNANRRRTNKNETGEMMLDSIPTKLHLNLVPVEQETSTQAPADKAIKTDARITQKTIVKYKSGNNIADCDCDCVIKKTCDNIRKLNFFTCINSRNSHINIGGLCDMVPDCPDKSDEKYCPNISVKLVSQANSVLSDINKVTTQSCFADLLSHPALSQKKMLENAIEAQSSFLELLRNGSSTMKLTNALTHIIDIVSSISSALDGALCSKAKSERLIDANLDDKESFNNEMIFFSSLPKKCICKNGQCIARGCSSHCSKVCANKNEFGRVKCTAKEQGATSVSLDELCDGKFDCFDKSDEKDCKSSVRLGKFEANQYFEQILKLINSKLTSKDFSKLNTKMLHLYTSIKKIQIDITNPYVDERTIKRSRDNCFTALSKIYDHKQQNAKNFIELDAVYSVLSEINNKLIHTLKKINIDNGDPRGAGNECLCAESRCIRTECSKVCVRTCASKGILNSFHCPGTKTTLNNLDHVCDNVNDCPDGADERDCKEDICRKHHLVMFRQRIEELGNNHIGTALGEVIKTWKAKSIGRLRVAENADRPTLPILKQLVGKVLRELVAAYASIEDTRRSDKDVMKDFLELSQPVLETLKLCGDTKKYKNNNPLEVVHS